MSKFIRSQSDIVAARHDVRVPRKSAAVGFTEAELQAAQWAKQLPEVQKQIARTTNGDVRGNRICLSNIRRDDRSAVLHPQSDVECSQNICLKNEKIIDVAESKSAVVKLRVASGGLPEKSKDDGRERRSNRDAPGKKEKKAQKQKKDKQGKKEKKHKKDKKAKKRGSAENPDNDDFQSLIQATSSGNNDPNIEDVLEANAKAAKKRKRLAKQMRKEQRRLKREERQRWKEEQENAAVVASGEEHLGDAIDDLIFTAQNEASLLQQTAELDHVPSMFAKQVSKEQRKEQRRLQRAIDVLLVTAQNEDSSLRQTGGSVSSVSGELVPAPPLRSLAEYAEVLDSQQEEQHGEADAVGQKGKDSKKVDAPADPMNPLDAAYDVEAYKVSGWTVSRLAADEPEWDHQGYLHRSPSPCRLRTEGAMYPTRKGAWRSRAGGVYLPPEKGISARSSSQSPARYLYPEEFSKDDKDGRRSPSQRKEARRSPSYKRFRRSGSPACSSSSSTSSCSSSSTSCHSRQPKNRGKRSKNA